MWVSDKWKDYELIDCSDGERLERWGKTILIRPDPQVIWSTGRSDPRWKTAAAHYSRSSSGGGSWDRKNTPESWQVCYKNLVFNVKPMNFKHMGLFPEQAVNWDYTVSRIRAAGRQVRLLSLFAYTGAATVAALSAGASVCHVDAARGMVRWAKDNAVSNNLQDAPVRWIIDDCTAFVKREIRRGHRYDAIIMDPPSYGRGPGGETWKLEKQLYGFIALCAELLSDNPLFVIINSYTAGIAPGALAYTAQSVFGGRTQSEELGLPVTSTGLALPCGAACRVSLSQ